MNEIRVRLAPSPTGYLHMGTARTAIFNWLFARQNNGKFILRSEDTDIERSKPEYEKDIEENLRWLGIEWDEGLHRQSERLDIYEKYLSRLLEEEKAYHCFCSKEDLEEDRKAMLAQGLPPKYSGRCRAISKEEAERKSNAGEPSVIRFKMPETDLEFNDLIRGKVKFDTSLIGDIAIAKNLRAPLFNFAVVVDDYEMRISHVIRGEDHISNTPKQIMIQRALGFDELQYAHLPMILNPDKSKMSKRHLETSVGDYRKQGYLPEAIFNFIALIGWHPDGEKELLSKEELISEFNLKKVQKGGGVFNIAKLDWLNSQYLKRLSPEELVERLKPFIPLEWTKDEKKRKIIVKVAALEGERIKKLSDFKELANFFFELPDYEPELLIWKEGDNGKTASNLKLVKEKIEGIFKEDFEKKDIENEIFPLAEALGRGDILWPLRVALSGSKFSPGPTEIMEALGKEETLKRIGRAIEKLS
jgi:glutamyl-tRNA synthetase